jgi:hypothetical protein
MTENIKVATRCYYQKRTNFATFPISCVTRVVDSDLVESQLIGLLDMDSDPEILNYGYGSSSSSGSLLFQDSKKFKKKSYIFYYFFQLIKYFFQWPQKSPVMIWLSIRPDP